MAITNKYFNEYGKEITEFQVDLNGRYTQATSINGSLKTKKRFSNQKLISSSYYLDDSESLEALKQNWVINQKQSWTFYYDKVTLEDNRQWWYVTYKSDGTLVFRGLNVYDFRGRIILDCPYKLESEEFLNDPKKSYYGLNEDETDEVNLLEFTYSSDGTLKTVYDVTHDYGYIKPISAQEFFDDTNFSHDAFPWEEHPYYHNLEPLLPTTPL
jgi:hypothetical protein